MNLTDILSTDYNPANKKHGLSCVGDKPCRVLEVAFGNWQQGDITRYEDDFSRPQEGE
jgi:mannose-1-phosphate guanylyltransferase/mannose-6-phosphate isomerase